MAAVTPILMSVAEVLDALAWHIAVAHPEFATTPHRQVWCKNGVALVPVPGPENAAHAKLNGKATDSAD